MIARSDSRALSANRKLRFFVQRAWALGARRIECTSDAEQLLKADHMQPLFRKVDCVSLRVEDLERAISFYQSELGHSLKWKTATSAGMAMAQTDTELVVHTEPRPTETEFLVTSVRDAITRFIKAGGSLVRGPFEIQIGLCAIVSDPWKNELVILDMSKGEVRVDKDKNVI